MIPIKKYFTEADRKAFYDSLLNRKQGKMSLLAHLVEHKNRHNFNSNLYGNEFIKEHLLTFFHGKCGYCEDFMGNVKIEEKPDWDWQIEHYRPKAQVFEDPTHGGYYWLAYECTNFLIVCPICNGLRRKADKFPIAIGTTRLVDSHFIENSSLQTDVCSLFHPIFKNEKPLLINPVVDKPKDFIQFFPDGTIKGKNERGHESIKIYGLDRQTLNIRRKKIIDNIRKSIAKQVKSLVGINDLALKNQKMKSILRGEIKELLGEIKNPTTPFIALRCAIFAHFDIFIITNENGIGNGAKPFMVPERRALSKAYLEIKSN
jgi:hypothetical protein